MASQDPPCKAEEAQPNGSCSRKQRHYQIGDGSDIILLLLDHVRLFAWISIRLLFLL